MEKKWEKREFYDSDWSKLLQVCKEAETTGWELVSIGKKPSDWQYTAVMHREIPDARVAA
jgi:hypothetical protein